MATYQFGAQGATGMAEGTYGLLQNFNETETGDEGVAQDANGNVADQTLYNNQKNITVEYVFDTEKTTPSRGDTVTVGSDKYAVMEVGKVESNTDYKRVNLTLKQYVNNSVPST